MRARCERDTSKMQARCDRDASEMRSRCERDTHKTHARYQRGVNAWRALERRPPVREQIKHNDGTERVTDKVDLVASSAAWNLSRVSASR
eukprot:416574-Pleurochrysis_carterae.AAC.1